MMDNHINEYIDYLTFKKKVSANTLESYGRDIMQFNEYLQNNDYGELTDASATLILNYLLDIQKKGKSSATASRAMSALKSYYKYLFNRKYISSDPTTELKSFKNDRKTPESLNYDEIKILLSAPVCKNPKGYRDRAIFELMYATGLKASDLLNIRIRDVNLKIGYVMIKKESKERIFPIYSTARDCLQDYLHYRDRIKNSDKTDYLFLNRDGSPLTRQGLWKIFKTYKQKCGLTADITPHILRHSYAVHLIENGADLKHVQELMGHSDINSTRIYEQAAKNKLFEAYKKAHPRAENNK